MTRSLNFAQSIVSGSSSSGSFFASKEGLSLLTGTSSSFVGYSPAVNPRMSVVVVSPDISHNNGSYAYQSAVTKRISANIVNKFFALNS